MGILITASYECVQSCAAITFVNNDHHVGGAVSMTALLLFVAHVMPHPNYHRVR